MLHVRIEIPKLDADQLEVLTRGWNDLPAGSQPESEAFNQAVASRMEKHHGEEDPSS